MKNVFQSLKDRRERSVVPVNIGRKLKHAVFICTGQLQAVDSGIYDYYSDIFHCTVFIHKSINKELLCSDPYVLWNKRRLKKLQCIHSGNAYTINKLLF